MSSLAQLAETTEDADLMARVKAFYDVGLKDISDPIGWSIENAGDAANPDRGEANNTGDILETALILGRYGYARYYDDAERILRAHLLPSQLRDISFIQEPANPHREDGKTNVAHRHLGAFGFPAPYGHHPLGASSISFNMDIVGGAVASLCEAFRHCVTVEPETIKVNLLFDYETEDVKVCSPYTGNGLSITLKRPALLYIRLPSWLDRQALVVRNADTSPKFEGDYLFINDAPVNRALTVQFQLTRRELCLKHRTRTIRTALEGDRVIAMDAFGANLRFFASL